MSTYLRILKKYGVLVEDNEDWVDELRRVPHRKDGETFKQWKIRIFGEDVEGLTVYAPYEPAQNTRMSTLAKECGSDYLLWALEDYRGMAEDEAEIALENTTEELTRKLTTVPVKILEQIIDETEDELESSAREFLERYIGRGDRNIDTKEILTDLIANYSKVVKRYRSVTLPSE